MNNVENLLCKAILSISLYNKTRNTIYLTEFAKANKKCDTELCNNFGVSEYVFQSFCDSDTEGMTDDELKKCFDIKDKKNELITDIFNGCIVLKTGKYPTSDNNSVSYCNYSSKLNEK